MANWSRKLLQKLNPLQVRHFHQTSRLCLRTTSIVRNTEPEDMDELQKNPHYSKYAGKIAKLQNTSPEEFMNRLGKLEEKVKAQGKEDERQFSMPTKAKGSIGKEMGMQKEKTLNDVMKIDLIKDKTTDEIAVIWKEHFLSKKGSLSAVIPTETYKSMKEIFTVHNTFLFALPRKEGYEFFVVQFTGNEAHFTSLINYQAFNENAPECLTLIHYTDLAETKGIVLMVGEYDSNILTTQDAQCLANQVEMYYCNPSSSKKALLETFTHKPAEFKHQDLLAQLENISLLTESPSTFSNKSDTDK